MCPVTFDKPDSLGDASGEVQILKLRGLQRSVKIGTRAIVGWGGDPYTIERVRFASMERLPLLVRCQSALDWDYWSACKRGGSGRELCR